MRSAGGFDPALDGQTEPRRLRRARSTWREIAEIVVVAPVSTTEVHVLPATAAVLWRSLDHEHTDAELVDTLVACFPDVERSVVEATSRDLVFEFCDLGIVDVIDEGV